MARLAELLGKDVTNERVCEWLKIEPQRDTTVDGVLGLSDLGNASVLSHCMDKISVSSIFGTNGFHWTGSFWQRDETGEVIRRAKETVKSIYA
jgi:hypothetical protein